MKFPNIYRVFALCVCLTAIGGAALSQNPGGQGGRSNPNQSPTEPRGGPGQTTTPSQSDRDRVQTDTNQSNTAGSRDTSTSFVSKATEINSAEIQLGQLALRKAQNDRVKSFAQMMVKDHTEAMAKFQGLQGQSQTNTSTTQSANTQNRDTAGTQNRGADTQNREADTQNREANTPNREGNTQNRGANAQNRDTPTSTQATSAASSGMPALSAEHRELMTKLEGLNDARFDREYINAMVNGHREAVKLFEREAGSSSNTSTASRTQTDTKNRSTDTTTDNQRRAETSTQTSGSSDTKSLAAEMLPTVRRHLQEAESIQKSLK